jgi:addiction module HigA family antidote
MLMHNPPHPGELIRDICLEPLNLSVTEAAKGLGVTRKTLSSLLNGHSNVSPMMAIRLAKAFGGSPESWLTHQLYFDLWQAQKQSKKLTVKDFRNAA